MKHLFNKLFRSHRYCSYHKMLFKNSWGKNIHLGKDKVHSLARLVEERTSAIEDNSYL